MKAWRYVLILGLMVLLCAACAAAEPAVYSPVAMTVRQQGGETIGCAQVKLPAGSTAETTLYLQRLEGEVWKTVAVDCGDAWVEVHFLPLPGTYRVRLMGFTKSAYSSYRAPLSAEGEAITLAGDSEVTLPQEEAQGYAAEGLLFPVSDALMDAHFHRDTLPAADGEGPVTLLLAHCSLPLQAGEDRLFAPPVPVAGAWYAVRRSLLSAGWTEEQVDACPVVYAASRAEASSYDGACYQFTLITRGYPFQAQSFLVDAVTGEVQTAG